MPITAKLSSKNQITVPRDVRKILGIGGGERVVFESDGEGRVILRKHGGTDSAGCGRRFLKPGRNPVTVRDMERARDGHFSRK